MSKLFKQELEDASGVTQKRGEEYEDYMQRLCDAVYALPTEIWDKIGKPAQDFYNSCADAISENKELPEFPDAPETATPARHAARHGAAPAVGVPQPGDIVVVTTNRDKVYEGKFVMLDGTTAVVEVDGAEMEFTPERTKSLALKEESSAPAADEEPQVGDDVTLTTKRNAVIEGRVLEINNTDIVLEVNGKEAEYSRDRVASIIINGGSGTATVSRVPEVGDWVKCVTKRNREVEGKVVEIDGTVLIVDTTGQKGGEVDVDTATAQSIVIIPVEKPTSGRRAASPAAASPAAATSPAAAPAAASPAAAPAAGKTGKVTLADNNGVSVTLRMRQIIAENPDITKDALGKQLDKEKLTYKANTLHMVYRDSTMMIELLKATKHFK